MPERIRWVMIRTADGRITLRPGEPEKKTVGEPAKPEQQ